MQVLTTGQEWEMVEVIKYVTTRTMSTRAQIGFYDKESTPIEQAGQVYVYKHSDGYPEGVLPLLKDFCQRFSTRRGLTDNEYAAARYVQALANEIDRFSQRFSLPLRQRHTSTEAESLEAIVDYLGVGIGTTLFLIDYFYHVSPTCITVYRTGWKGEKPTFKKIDTFRLRDRNAS